MKKIFSFIAAALSLTAVSCMKEASTVEAPAEETVVFTATTNATKTTLVNGNTSTWVAGDKITIYNGTQGYEFETKQSGPSVDFEYNGNDFSGEKFMAVYPAGTYTADLTAKTVIAHVPTYQEGVIDTYNAGAALAVAYTENEFLKFKNATALIKFKVIGQKVKGLIFYGHNNEAVSGNVLVSLNEDNTIKSVVGQETEITEGEVTETKYITWAKVWAPESSGNYFVDGETYYLAVVPQNFENGFTFQLEVDGVGNVDVLKYETAYELKPNTILNIGDVSAWSVAGSFNDWNATANPMKREGDYYVIKNVTNLHYTEENNKSKTGFKFVHNGTWTATGNNSGKLTSKVWEYNWDNNNDYNMYVDGATAEQAFDIYLNPNEGSAGKFVVVPAGEGLPSETPETPDTPDPTPDTDTPTSCKLTIRVNKSIDWYDKYIFAWTSGNLCGAWPGTKTEWDKEDGNYYVYYYVFDASLNGTTINYIINKGEGGDGNQTKDLQVTLNGAETVVTIEASDKK